MTKKHSVTKRMLAMLLAVLMMFSGMAVSASAADEKATPVEPGTTAPVAPTVPKPKAVQDDLQKKITVTPPTVAGYKASDVIIEISPSASYIPSNGDWVYINLNPGTKYTIRAYVVFEQKPVYSGSVEITLKAKQDTPTAPVAAKVTSTTITAVKVSNCEYRLSDAKGNVIYNWGDTVVFEKLTPHTPYILSTRAKKTEDKFASDAASITVKTLHAGKKTAVGKPILVDKTDKTVIVKCAPEDENKKIEFSIDKGKTWQHSGEFKNLTPYTIYGVIAREAFDPAVQDPNPSSKILEFRTNSKPRVAASLSNCTFKLHEEKVYANVLIGVTVTGDGPDDYYVAEYGDTRLVPYSIIADGREYLLEKGEGEFLPGSRNANKEMTVTVIYEEYRYNGGGDWKYKGTVESLQEIKVGPNRNIFTVLGDFFVTVINFFGDTLPTLILATGGLWEKGIALLFGMFDKIGVTK